MNSSNKIIALQIFFLLTATIALHSTPSLLLDDCENSELITINKKDIYSTYSFSGTTHSNDICNNNLSSDIWLKFEAPSQRIVLNIHHTSNSTFTLFGGSCTDLEYVECYTYAFNTDFDSLEIGQIYFLKISSNDDEEVRFKLESVPENNSFQNAHLLNPDTCFVDYTIYNQLYYEFTPSKEVYELSVYFLANGINQHEDITFYNENFDFIGKFEAPFRELLPDPNLNAFWAKLNLRVQIGKKYFVKLQADERIEFCIKELDAGIDFNDTWQDALELSLVTVEECEEYQITDYGASSISSLNEDNLSCIPDPGERDSWYIFDAFSSEITFRGPSFEFQIYEFFDESITFLDCPIIEGSHSQCSFITPSFGTIVRELNQDSTYLLRTIPTLNLPALPSCPPPQGYISIGKFELNANDEIENAIDIEINNPFECIYRTNISVANSTLSDPSIFENVCDTSSILNRDTWFTFTPLDTIINILLEQTLLLEILYFEVYSGEIGNLHCIQKGTVDSNQSIQDNNISTRISNLSIGEKHYLRIVSGSQNNQLAYEVYQQFCLRYISAPPSNDHMENPLNLFPSNNLTDCILSDSLLFNNVDNDVWFSFDATAPNHQFYIRSSNLSFDTHLFIREENGDTSLVSKHESFPTVFPPTGYNVSGANEKAGYLRGDNFFLSIFNYSDLEIGGTYLIKMGLLFNEEDYNPNMDIEVYNYQFCLKTLPISLANNTYYNSEVLIQYQDHLSRQFGYLTESIPDQEQDSLFLNCKVSNDIHYEQIRPEAWYTFTAEKSDYTLFFDDLTSFDEDGQSIFPFQNILDSTFTYSLFTRDSSNQLLDLICNQTLALEQEINNLVEGEEYFLSIRMDCLNYLTDLNFKFGLSQVLDEDSDGYYSDVDCDDTNADINPIQIEEPYNGIDDDCNPETLDDDLDQDGFLLVDDCDDQNPDINPNATEIPNNGIDEDCDGMDGVSATHEIANVVIKIFPNPVIDILYISIDGQLNYQANLYDTKGKLIISESNQTQMNLEPNASGAYLLEIIDLNTNQKIVEKIIVM